MEIIEKKGEITDIFAFLGYVKIIITVVKMFVKILNLL